MSEIFHFCWVLFIYAKGKKRIIFMEMLVYLNVWVLLLSAYNVYQEKILSEKFLSGFSHRFFFQVLPFHRNLLDFLLRSKSSLIKWKSFKFVLIQCLFCPNLF